MITWSRDADDAWSGYDRTRARCVVGVRFDGDRWYGIIHRDAFDDADMEILILESYMPARPRFSTADEAKRWAEETYTGFRAAATLRNSR